MMQSEQEYNAGDFKSAIEFYSKICEILGRGNTAEVKKRKDDIIILEVSKQIKKSYHN